MAAERIPTGGDSEEYRCLDVDGGEKKKLRVNRDRLSILAPDGGICELVQHVATEVTAGLEVPDNDYSATPPQGGNGDEISITIAPYTAPASVHNPMTSVPLLPRVLLTLALLTLIMDIATALYKPPSGVVFGHHRLLYYLTLAGIFVAGVVEALTALWISRSHDTYRRCFSFGRVVLCASIVPFVIIIAISGFAFISG